MNHFIYRTSSTAFKLFVFVMLIAFSKSSGAQNTSSIDSNILLADPTIFFNNGTYYLYGTGGGPQHNQGFVVYTSADLKTWEGPKGAANGYALKKGDAFGSAGFWAPQVFKQNGKFLMAYTANEHIAIAVSDDPLGPFKQEVKKSIIEENKQIDPFIFIDDGKKYLYHVIVANGGNRIFVAELNDDMLSIKNETLQKCIEANTTWENTENAKWSVTEGPTVLKHKNVYYLIYSANDFRNKDYAVGYATGKTPYGPWKKYEGNPIIRREIVGTNGSGHGDFVKNKKGEWVYVFHTHNSDNKVSPRKTAIIKARFIADKKTGIDKLVVDASSFSYLHSTSSK